MRKLPKYFDKEHFTTNDKLTKQFLKGIVKISTYEKYAKIDSAEK